MHTEKHEYNPSLLLLVTRVLLEVELEVTIPFFFLWTGSTPKTPEWYIPGKWTFCVCFCYVFIVVNTLYILLVSLYYYCNTCLIPAKVMTDRI